jgi:uncharacterized protein (TIGR04222 family)
LVVWARLVSVGSVELTAPELAYLRGGARLAVRTGLAMLYLRGLVEIGPKTRVGPMPADRFERSLYTGLDAVVEAPALQRSPVVRAGLAELENGLVARKLLRRGWRRMAIPFALTLGPPFLLGRFVDLPPGAVPLALVLMIPVLAAALWFALRLTLAGSRLVREDRRRNPVPPVAARPTNRMRPRLDPDTAGLLIARFGDAGLRATVPLFASESHLLDRGRS